MPVTGSTRWNQRASDGPWAPSGPAAGRSRCPRLPLPGTTMSCARMRRLSQWVGMQSTHPWVRKLRTGPTTPQANPRHTPLVTAVLHVTHYCLPHIGGLEIVVAAETTRLAERRWDVALVSSAWGAPAGVATENGVRVVRVRAWHQLEPRFGVPFPVFSPWLLVALFREVRRASIVHIHDPLVSDQLGRGLLVPAAADAVRRPSARGLRAPLVVRRTPRSAGGPRQLRPARARWCQRHRADRRVHRFFVPTRAPSAHAGDRQRRRHCSLPPCLWRTCRAAALARPARRPAARPVRSGGSFRRRGSPSWQRPRATTTDWCSSVVIARRDSTIRDCTSWVVGPPRRCQASIERPT